MIFSRRGRDALKHPIGIAILLQSNFPQRPFLPKDLFLAQVFLFSDFFQIVLSHFSCSTADLGPYEHSPLRSCERRSASSATLPSSSSMAAFICTWPTIFPAPSSI
ncbi:hypothetical protein BS47DRAFT_987457 [Hydnum rufescens UP504]|uniref:Uncharacterized protein n=1 Tax=Hydnum rufescens UP504 TaxID=1448309 RepID=A0A9P6AW52_9AGAM|nr:hypothetical protein BS47DRAFT_987457 [Hydnum rufescens UP504]